ncbi:FtsW/RodA/SpoVE family cell cycle protein [Fusobacterium sp. PH5-44]|uniref:FtsW/RodA/SpoVE family cell cycle protein n=1 Tax=unclassified Fusobacterium TaxID=2648384 RepID=UPI003D21EC54
MSTAVNVKENSIYSNANSLGRKKKRNRSILIILISLLVISIVNMFSTCLYYTSTAFNPTVRNHTFYLLFSFGIFCAFCVIDYRNYHKNSWSRFVLIGSLALLLFILIGAKVWPSVIPTINGSTGWIRLPAVSIQPSEMIKLPFIIIIAHLLSSCDEKKITNMGVVLTVFPILATFSVLIIMQNDLGTTIHYFVIFLFILFCSKIDMSKIVFVTTSAMAIGFSILVYVHTAGYEAMTSYKWKRIWAFLTGILNNEYDDNIGYQVGQSIMAFGNGGSIGQGFANGTQKYSYLPEIRTDFILATFGEEFGFAGMIVLIIGFCLLFSIIRSTAVECEDNFGKYLAIGIGGFIITQMLINMYVALGLVPVFGVPMPILSYGGTSLVTIFASMGIVVNMNSNKRNRLK